MSIDELEFKRWFQHVVNRSGRKIEQSRVFMSIYSANYDKEPQLALELGIATLLDKPIVVMAPIGTHLPDNIRRLARAIEFVDPTDPKSVEVGTRAIVALLKEQGI